MRSFLAGVALALAACATRPDGSAQPLHAPAAAASLPPTAAGPPTPARDLRRLSAGSSFADWVEAAGLLDAAAAGRSEAGCLLRDGDPLRFEADLLLAAHPLPRPEPGLATQLEEQFGAPAVITAWGGVIPPARGAEDRSAAGAAGDNSPTLPGGAGRKAPASRGGELLTANSGMVLLAFTTTTPGSVRMPPIALFATRSGTFVRADDLALRAQRDALPGTSAAALLARVAGPATVYVSADPDVASNELLQLLRAIPNRFEIALAVALPKSTRLPPPAADNRDGLCPDGLPEPAADLPEGELSAAAAGAAFAPLREAALTCALTTGGRALLGGRLVLGVRVGADGKVSEACFVNDAIAEPMLRRCLVSAARDASLPLPSPPGFVDLHIPLEISLDGPQRQRASCD
jgi:hypothetical protein